MGSGTGRYPRLEASMLWISWRLCNEISHQLALKFPGFPLSQLQHFVRLSFQDAPQAPLRG